MSFSYCNSSLYTLECNYDFYNLVSTTTCILCIALPSIYAFFFVHSIKLHLHYLHDLRTLLVIFSLLVNTCEILQSCLIVNPPDKSLYRITSSLSVYSATLYFASTLTIAAFIRIIEVRNKPDWIILSALVQLIQGVMKGIRFWYITEGVSLFSLKPFLLFISTALLLALGVLDSIIFFEKSSKKLYESTVINDNIGYKQPFSTFLSKITFWWLTPLLWKGYLEPLELEHLGNLHEKDTTRFHYDQFLFIYQNNKKSSLWICYIKSCWKLFMLGGFLKLLGDLTGLFGPLSISYIVDYISISANSTNGTFNELEEVVDVENLEYFIPEWDDFLKNGWIICVLVLLSSLAQGTLSQCSSHLINMEGIKLKNALQGLIYRKTLQLNSSCFTHKVNNNEETETSEAGKQSSSEANKSQCYTDVGTITNLMSEDTFSVMSFILIAHYVWAIPLKIIIVMYLLFLKLGISAIIGSVICICMMTPLQFLIGKMMSANSKIAAECTDDRLKRINEVLLGIKLIKLNAWDNVFKDKINESRRRELKHLNIDSVLWTLMTFLTHVSSVLITIVTFLILMNIDDGENRFTAANVFTALALFNQLTVPLFIFPITVPIIISAVLSTKRLEHFFAGQEVQKEFEGVRNMARILCKSDASLDVFEEENSLEGDSDNATNDLDRNSLNSLKNSEDIIAPPVIKNMGRIVSESISEIVAVPAQCTKSPKNHSQSKKVKLRKNNQISLSCKLEKNRLRQRTLSGSYLKDIQISTISDDHVVTIENGVFKWSINDTDNFLNISKLIIPKGKLTVVVGRNGTGKSSLLAALLKEMNYVSGEIKWNKYSTIAYVPQNPWLMNASVRDNILFGELYRPKRYERILKACALKPDIELMEYKDMTEIGERGINLSGGQRQRITIARALYSSANVVVMDDPLSSLDNEVGKYLFENGIKKILLQHRRTAILVTQKLQLIHSADNIIVMENNMIKLSGTLAEIETIDANIVQEWNSIITAERNNEDQSQSIKITKGWKLLKNVSKLGFHRHNVTNNDNISMKQDLYKPKKKLSSVYGSRYLAHDLPLPIDVKMLNENAENVELRRQPSRRSNFFNSLEYVRDHKNVLRVSSLQINAKVDKSSPNRHISSPPELNCSSNRNSILSSSGEESSIDNVGKIGFRQFLRRVSTNRKFSGSPSASLREKIKLQGSVIEHLNEEEEHVPVRRLISSNSKYSEDTEDDVCLDYNNEELSNQIFYSDERKYGEIPNQIYWLYIKSCGLAIVCVFFTSASLLQGLKVYTDVWLQNLTKVNSETDEIKYYFKIYGVLSGLCILISAITTPAGQICGCNARRVLHNRLIRSLFKYSLYYLQSIPLGRLMNRFSYDMTVIDKKIAATSQRLLQFILLCLCAVLINTAVTPWFIFLTIPICLIYYVIQKFFRYSSRELQRIEGITSSPIITHFSETIQGVTTIRAYNQESRFMEMLFKKMEANNVAFITLNCSNRWLGIALDYLGGIIVFVAIITSLTTSQLYPQSTTSSLVGLAINYTLLVPIYLNWVVKLLADMEMYFGAVERVQYYLDIVNEESVHYKPVPISWPQRGDISFENISLKYENQKDNVITDLTLYVPAGQKIGICGRSGSGKSSLAMSLFGVLQITNGRIMIDDVDIAAIHLDELRARLSVIPQDVILFSGTIRDNLDPRGHFSDLELWNCIEIAQLKEILNSQSLGLDTQIVDGGSNFSTGQKQLFCLARAVLRGSVCLVLDEATSSLDAETELALLKAASTAFQGRTIITIAHRLHSLLDYDRVIVLDNGKIIEDGNPNDLRNDRSSKFAAMIKASETTGIFL